MAEQDPQGPDELENQLRSRSPSRVSPRQGGGISPLDLLELPPDLQRVMTLLVREGACTVAQVAEHLNVAEDEAFYLLDTLVARGHLRRHRQEDKTLFEPILGHIGRPGLSSTLWDKLKED